MRRTLMSRLHVVLALLSSAAAGCWAEDPQVEPVESAPLPLRGGFAADFAHCTEGVGFVSVPFDRARPLVPEQLSLAGEELDQATLIVRAFDCDEVSVDGGPPTPGIVGHVGISIVSPDGTGDGNFSTLWYVTDVSMLAARLRAAGVPVQNVQRMTYTVTGDGDGAAYLSAAAPRPADPSYTLEGPITEPPPDAPDLTFLANWFWIDDRSAVEMSTYFPHIRLGGAQLTLQAPASSSLAELVGAPMTGFNVEYSAVFAAAHMDVIVTPL